MIKKLIIAIFSLLFFQNLHGQKNIEWIFPLEKQAYIELEFFVDSVAIVKVSGKKGLNPFFKNNKYSLINRENEFITDSTYSSVSRFNNYFKVFKKGLEGILNSKGEEIIPAKYRKISLVSINSKIFFEYRDFSKTRKYLDHNGNPFDPIQKEGMLRVENNLLQYFNKRGGKVKEICYNDTLNNLMGCRSISDRFENDRGLILKKDGKWGLIDSKNNSIKIPHSFDSLRVIKMKNYLVYLENKRWGIIDEHGKRMTPPIYDMISYEMESPFSRSQIGTTTYFIKDNYWGIINDELKETVNFIDIECSRELHVNDLYWFREKKHNGKWGVINGVTGEKIVQPIYDMKERFYGGISFIHKDKKVGLINKNGKILFPPEYDFVYRGYLSDSDGIIILKKDNEVFVINRSGELLFSKKDMKIKIGRFPSKSPYITPESKVIIFKKDKKVGVLSREGEIILPPAIYYNVEFYKKSGIHIFELDGKLGLVLPNNKLIPAKYNQIFPPDIFGSKAVDDYILIEENGFWGLMDMSGKITFNPIYTKYTHSKKHPYILFENLEGNYDLFSKETLEYFKATIQSYHVNRNNLISLKIDDKWGLYDKYFNEVIPPSYDNISCSETNECVIEKGDKIGLLKITKD